MSLDMKYENVVKSMYLYLERKQTTLLKQQANLADQMNSLVVLQTTMGNQQTILNNKHKVLAEKQASTSQDFVNLRTSNAQKIGDLTQELTLQREQQDLNSEEINSLKKRLEEINTARQSLKERFSSPRKKRVDSGSCCLKKVLDHISKELGIEERKTLLKKLGIEADNPRKEFSEQLEDITWSEIKKELEVLERNDIVKYIKKNTLLTKDLQRAASHLKEHYLNELIRCLVEQPLSQTDSDIDYVMREDVYIDLVVLPSSTVDKEWSNSDRDALVEQQKLVKSTVEKDIKTILLPSDEVVFIRGVAGIGKSTLLDMFTLKWAKNEISNGIDFVFKFTCRELNNVSTNFNNLEQLFKLKFPDVMQVITFKNLMEISERVLIVVDGIDELRDLYEVRNDTVSNGNRISNKVFELLNPKTGWLLHHKSIVCGRPRATEFIKKQLPPSSKRKTVEVCGFDDKNIEKYIQNFFRDKKEKAVSVQTIIESSYDLRIMARVPVFLYI
eukprot:TCONS_00062222-protein